MRFKIATGERDDPMKAGVSEALLHTQARKLSLKLEESVEAFYQGVDSTVDTKKLRGLLELVHRFGDFKDRSRVSNTAELYLDIDITTPEEMLESLKDPTQIARRNKRGALLVVMPQKIKELFLAPARIRCAYGGRGSGKTYNFATMVIIEALKRLDDGQSGCIICAREFQNSIRSSSLAALKEVIEQFPQFQPFFEVGDTYLKARGVRGNQIDFYFIGLRRSIQSIRSKHKILLMWVDEAEEVSEEAWRVILPTLRDNTSELWVTWNPRSPTSATHRRFVTEKSEDTVSKSINYFDNPMFPAILEIQRKDDFEKRPDVYDHIWNGHFDVTKEGAYYTKQIAQMEQEGRLCDLALNPMFKVKAFFDIGGAGRNADLTTIWFAQFIDGQIHVIDYYEAQGVSVQTHVDYMRQSGYSSADIILPHDGHNHNSVSEHSFYSYMVREGFHTECMPNAGKGAVMQRIDTTRLLFDRVHMDRDRTKGGLYALRHYHEKRNAITGQSHGANHDWSSHAADAFGLMCLYYSEVYKSPEDLEKTRRLEEMLNRQR